MKVIVDTDIGNDCDDAGALSILHNIAKLKDIDILAILSSTSLVEGAQCVEAINNYYNHQTLIGYNTVKGYFDSYPKKTYTQIVAEKFYHQNQYTTYTKAFRKVLATTEDQSVVFVILGPLHALKMALDSTSDEYSLDTGLELFNKKVKKVYIMAGKFSPEHIYFEGNEVISEWNVKCDIPSFQYFMNHVDREMTFIPFELGLTLAGANLKDTSNPVKVSYDYYSKTGLRNTWDPIAMYYALTNDNLTFKRTKAGNITIANDGFSTFEENVEGKHYVLLKNTDDERILEVINTYLH